MRTLLQVLSEEEKNRIHESSLMLLEKTGVRVESSRARGLLLAAGAAVDQRSRIVRFPKYLVEKAIESCPERFSLGARRKGFDLDMNSGKTWLCMDGEAVNANDYGSREIRRATEADWLNVTRLGNHFDEVGMYWTTVTSSDRDFTGGNYIDFLRLIVKNFTKHIQEPAMTVEESKIMREFLNILFGSDEQIRQNNPWSFLLCPQTPFIIDEEHTDAWLELADLMIPASILTMPIMGATSPASLVSTVLLGNAETLAMLTLVQAASPGTPVIYSPANIVMNPRNGDYTEGFIEDGLLAAATTEMGRYYNLPVMASSIGCDYFYPGIQAGTERGMNALMTTLAKPDLLLGPGLLGGAMILNLEQFCMDVDIFRRGRRAAEGINGAESRWYEELLTEQGPGGSFIAEMSTAEALYDGEWLLNGLGVKDNLETWQAGSRNTIIDEAHEQVEMILAAHEEEELGAEVEKELEALKKSMLN